MKAAFRHCCRSGHAGLGVSEARAVSAALPAGERRGRRAAGALFLHRLRRVPGSAARCGGSHGRRTQHAPRPQTTAELLNALRGALARAPQPRPEIPGVPLSGGLVGYTAYDAVRYFERLPGRSLRRHRHAARALRGAALAAGVRSSHPQRRAAARRQRGGAASAAPRGHARAARRGPDRCSCPGASRRRLPRCREERARGRRAARAGIHRLRRCVSAGAGVAIRGPPLRWRRSRCTGRCGCSIRPLTCIFCELGDITVVGSSPEALVQVARRPRAAAAHRGLAAARRRCRRATLRSKRSCSPIPRRTPSTSCWSIWRATISGGWRDAGSVRRRSVSRDRALQPHHAHRERRQRRGSRRGTTRSICSRRPSPPARWWARRRCAPCRSSTSSSRWGGSCTAARWVTSAGSGDMDQAITIRTLVFQRRHVQLSGGRRHRRRQLPARRIRGAHGEERGAARVRSSIAAEGL